MSDLAARREARIRKILENSSTRLKKITNISEDFADETATCSQDETVPLKLEEETSSISKPIKKINTNKSPKPIREDEPTQEGASHSITPSSIRYILIALLAILIRHILLIADFGNETNTLVYYGLNKIFLPFFMFEIVDFTFFKPFVQHFNYLNILHLFNLGLTSNTVTNFIVAMQIVLKVMQDAMVYFFTFICFGGIIDVFELKQ